MTAVLGQMAEQPKDGGSPLIGTPGVATPPSLLTAPASDGIRKREQR